MLNCHFEGQHHKIFSFRKEKRVRITPRHIMLTLRMDRELDELTRDVTLPQVRWIDRWIDRLIDRLIYRWIDR